MTYLMEPAEFGAVRNAIATCNLILPVINLCVWEGVIRFGLDRAYRKSDVFTTGILTVLGGYLIFLCMAPLLARLPFVHGYEWLVAAYILASASRTMTTHFVRSGNLIRIFAIDGMLTSAVTLGFIYLFVFVLGLGGAGYMLSTICADALSAASLFVMLRLNRFVKLRGFRRGTARSMLAYSSPLVATSVFWWVTNVSSQFFVTMICGDDANGLYVIAATIPSVITHVSALFIQAWQISAFSENDGADRERFFSVVFRCYYSFIFLAVAGIILIVRPATGLLYEEKFYDSWQYVPFLVLAVGFSCFVTFLGTIYNSVKKNTMVTVTTAVGASINLLLNWLMIPRYGPVGAAAATFISYFVVFVIRAVDTRRYIRINMQPMRILASLGLLLLQIWICLAQPPFGGLWQGLVILALTVCNLGYLLFLGQRMIGMVRAKM